MSDFNDLQNRAVEIRQKYDQLNKEKLGVEWTATDLMSGFVVDVGDLSKLIMAKKGLREMDNIDEELAHELADCLWSVLVLADKLDIDLEAAFQKNMNDLEARIVQDL